MTSVDNEIEYQASVDIMTNKHQFKHIHLLLDFPEIESKAQNGIGMVLLNQL